MHRLLHPPHFALVLAAFIGTQASSPARAFDCPDLKLETLPTAEAGSYPPDRIVLRTDCMDCKPPLGVEVSVEGEPIAGVETVLTVGELAFVIWQPTEALEVGATYDLFREGYDGATFNRTATIRSADDASDGRGLDPFAGIEWRLTERESVTARACCTQHYEDCEADCWETMASRPVLEVSGKAAPWFVYRLITEDFGVSVTRALGPFFEVSSEWTFEATLQRPSQSLCVRLIALNLLTDEEVRLDHCEAIDPSASFEPGAWAVDWVKTCDRMPRVACVASGSVACETTPEELVSAWCGTSIEECRTDRGEYEEYNCEDAAERCAPFWMTSNDDAGADAAMEDAEVSEANERDESGASCAVRVSPERSRRPHAWASLAMIAAVLTRLRRQRRSHNS